MDVMFLDLDEIADAVFETIGCQNLSKLMILSVLIQAQAHCQQTRKSHWDDIPGYPTEDWRDDVIHDYTRLGYEDWAHHQKEADDGDRK